MRKLFPYTFATMLVASFSDAVIEINGKLPMNNGQTKSLIQTGVYEHYKSTPENVKQYKVIDVAIHSETGEYMVVYRPLYGNFKLTVRPLDMFLQKVFVDNKEVPRFKFISELKEEFIPLQEVEMVQTGIYEHYKSTPENVKQYKAIDVAIHSETGEHMMVYRPLYDHQKLTVRPLSMFLDKVSVNNKEVPRFKFISELKEEFIPLQKTDRIRPGIYEHYKSTPQDVKQYRVIDVAINSETGNKMVVYRPLYGSFELTVRPLEMFSEQVFVNNIWVPRFKFISN